MNNKNGVFSIAWKDIQVLLTERGNLIMLFVLPLVFVVAFSAVFSLQDDTPESVELPTVNLDMDSVGSKELIESLGRAGITATLYDQDTAEAELADGKLERMLIIPVDYDTSVRKGVHVDLRLVLGKDADAGQTEAILLILEGVARDLSLQTQLLAGLRQMGEMMGGTPDSQDVFTAERIVNQASSQFERSQTQPLIAIERSFPDIILEEREQFSAVDLSVPGFLVLFVFLTATTTATSLFGEKKNGGFMRLLAAPIGKAEILAGKILPNIITTLLQIVVVFGVSILLLPVLGFGKLSLQNYPALIVLSLLLSTCSASLGLFIGSIARTEGQISTLGAMILWVMGAVSGAFIPRFFLGPFLGSVGKVIPHYWAISAFQDVIVRGHDLAGISLQLLVLAGFTLFFGLFGLWRFRFN